MSTSNGATTTEIAVSGTQVIAVPENATHVTVAANSSANVTFSIAAPTAAQKAAASLSAGATAAWAWVQKNWVVVAVGVLAFVVAKLIK